MQAIYLHAQAVVVYPNHYSKYDSSLPRRNGGCLKAIQYIFNSLPYAYKLKKSEVLCFSLYI
jgi:hypothetical protein